MHPGWLRARTGSGDTGGRAGPWKSTMRSPTARSVFTGTDAPPTHARVRPSEVISRRRISSPPSASPPCSSTSASAGWFSGRRKCASTVARSAPVRTMSEAVLMPRSEPSAPIRMDLPAPVSPVMTLKWGENLQVQAVDEREVSNGEFDQHVSLLRPRATCVRATYPDSHPASCRLPSAVSDEG